MHIDSVTNLFKIKHRGFSPTDDLTVTSDRTAQPADTLFTNVNLPLNEWREANVTSSSLCVTSASLWCPHDNALTTPSDKIF